MEISKDTHTLDEVFTKEAEYIIQRRHAALGSWADKLGSNNLIGLALSGGGMRSATFNLGVVQALSRLGILPWIDYLATVSGGGYLGSCFTTLLSMRTWQLQPGDEIWVEPPQEYTASTPEPVKHPVQAEIIGKEWWRITYGDNFRQKGWVAAYPAEICPPNSANAHCLSASHKLLVWQTPATELEPLVCLPANQPFKLQGQWYQLRYKPCPEKNVWKTGWFQRQRGERREPAFKFNISDEFPFDPNFLAFSSSVEGSTGVATAPQVKERNHQLYHMRLYGNFIIPRRGLFKQDTLRLIGSAITGISRMIALFGVWFLMLAVIHYILAGLIAPDTNERFFFPPITTTPLPDLLALLFFQKAVSPAAEFEILRTYGLYLIIGVACALLVYLYILRFYARGQPDKLHAPPGLSPSEYKAKLLLRDGVALAFTSLITLEVLTKSEWYQPVNASQGSQLYHLWLPATFALGCWFVSTYIYPFFFQTRLWNSEFRSVIASWQGLTVYGLIVAIAFAVLALPYYLKIASGESRSNNLTLFTLTTVLSGVWSYILAGGLAKDKVEGLMARAPAGLRTLLLNFLVVVLVISVILLFGTLFEQMPKGTPAKANTIFYLIIGGAVILVPIFLIAFFIQQVAKPSEASGNSLLARVRRFVSRLLRLIPDALFRVTLPLIILCLTLQITFLLLGWFNLETVLKSSSNKLYFSAHYLLALIWRFLLFSGLFFLGWFSYRVGKGFWQGEIKPWPDRRAEQLLSLRRIVSAIPLIILAAAGVYFRELTDLKLGPPWNDAQWVSVLMIGLLTGLLLILLSQYINLNQVSFHYFYRDRLIDAFFKTGLVIDLPEQVIPVRDQDEIRLQDINPDDSPAPYHLLVATLNLPGSKSLTYKDSKSEPFIFSRYYCGSNKTRFLPTHLYQGGLTKLARAPAISGAAASATLGQYTFFAQAFIMSLFNVRLGYWVDNPYLYCLDDLVARSRKWDFTQLESNATLSYESNIFWAKYLWYELTGTAHSQKKLVNLSDGGHTDNLALYPLLQRRCKLIIISDAGRDPAYEFCDLARLVRRIYIEENIKIDINLDPLQANRETGLSHFHAAVGEIHYPKTGTKPSEKGWLIYFKPAITGDETGNIKSYWWNHRLDFFPQQTTADQFYDDDQFEAYRCLGEHTVEHTLKALKLYYDQVIDQTPAEYEQLAEWSRRIDQENYLLKRFQQLVAQYHGHNNFPNYLEYCIQTGKIPVQLDPAPTSEPQLAHPSRNSLIQDSFERRIDQFLTNLEYSHLMTEKILGALLNGRLLREIIKDHLADNDAHMLERTLQDLKKATSLISRQSNS